MLDRILDQVADFKEKFAKDAASAWFRGHRLSDWQLKSTLHRHFERLIANLDPPMPTVDQTQCLRKEAKSLYRQFRADAWPLLQAEGRSEWVMLFTMQHYRLPTRLLDWTQSFACALFFAHHKRQPGESAAVWMLKPERLNELSVERDGLFALDDSSDLGVVNVRDWHPHWKVPSRELKTIAVSPVFTNPRMTTQRAAFTLMGDSFLPLERQFEGRLVQEGALIKIELPAEEYEEVESYLDVNGLTAFTFYPDMEGLALKHEAKVATTLRQVSKFYPDRVKKSSKI